MILNMTKPSVISLGIGTVGTNLTLDSYEVAELKHSLSLIIDSSLVWVFFCQNERVGWLKKYLDICMVPPCDHLPPHNLVHFWVYKFIIIISIETTVSHYHEKLWQY